MNPVHFSDDRNEQRRQWNAYLDEIDREIADEKAQAGTFDTDIGKVLESKPNWRNLPPVKLRPGTKRTTEQEDAYLDRCKY
jgi:hypothetical protein